MRQQFAGLIGLYNPDTETITYIHVQHQLYMENAGAILKKHYDTPAKIWPLLRLGDLSYLGTRPEVLGKYEDPEQLTAQHPFYDKCQFDMQGKGAAQTIDIDLMRGLTWAMCKAAQAEDCGAFVFINNKWRYTQL